MLENIEMELLSQKSTWPSMLWIWGKRKKTLYALHIQLDHAAQIERDASWVETPGENRMERPVRGLKSIRTGEMRGSATNRFLSRTEPEKRSKPQRKENQDVSEVIPPAVPNAPASKEVQDDRRVFKQSEGMDSGIAAGEEEIYNVFIRPGEVAKMCLRVSTGPVNVWTRTWRAMTSAPGSRTTDSFLMKCFLVETIHTEAKKDQFTLRKILWVWTRFWHKPNSTTV